MNSKIKLEELIKELNFVCITKLKYVLIIDDDTRYEVFIGDSVGCFMKIYQLKLTCLSGTSQGFDFLYDAILKELKYERRKKKIKNIL